MPLCELNQIAGQYSETLAKLRRFYADYALIRDEQFLLAMFVLQSLHNDNVHDLDDEALFSLTGDEIASFETLNPI